jgi:hypothetical protein
MAGWELGGKRAIWHGEWVMKRRMTQDEGMGGWEVGKGAYTYVSILGCKYPSISSASLS